jgi:hypothetical protein
MGYQVDAPKLASAGSSCRSLLAGDVREKDLPSVSDRLQAGSYKMHRILA